MSFPTIELTVDSPFNWKERCTLVIPDKRTIPSFDDPGWEAGLGPAVESIIKLVRGRTMVLFTSRARMKDTRRYLERRRLPFNIYADGAMSPGEITKFFKSDIDSVLLGCKRFSEGIDVQGESCTCVIIDKLPFRKRGDPLLEAIGDLRAFEEGITKEEGGKLAFNEQSVPEAIISFKQRMGRLIRTTDDCGVVVVLDDRLVTRRYGRRFIRSIPSVPQTRNENDIVSFLKRLGAL